MSQSWLPEEKNSWQYAVFFLNEFLFWQSHKFTWQNLWFLSAAEHFDGGLPDAGIDADVQEGVDEAVEVHEHHNIGQDLFLDIRFARRHEVDKVGGNAEDEDDGDGAHHQSDPSLFQEGFHSWPE